MGNMGTSTNHSGKVDNFTNDSAMMIAYERALESSRPDALFQDPFASVLAGSKGRSLSAAFEANCVMFEFPEWPEFHKTWTAVRTKFIDDRIVYLAGTGAFPQVVNLGAGMDTRAYRLDSYKAFTNGSFEVDMEAINAGKPQVFRRCLGKPKPYCGAVHLITLDFLDTEKTLSSELKKQAAYDPTKPSLFVAEGLIMYLGAAGKLKLIDDVSAVAAPGSVFILQYLDGSETEAGIANPAMLSNALSIDEATRAFTSNGWSHLEFFHYGDEKLNFGRYPIDRFKPTKSFSFVVCVKS